MSDTPAENRAATPGPAGFAPQGGEAPTAPREPAPPPAPPRPPGLQRLTAVVKGRIDVADEVVENVAALAAIEVEGVADLGGDFEPAIETVHDRIGVGQRRGDQGVEARVQGREVAIDATILIEYGHVVMDVARKVQANVAYQTNRMLGLTVVEVNVTVDDVRLSRPWARYEDEQGPEGLVPDES